MDYRRLLLTRRQRHPRQAVLWGLGLFLLSQLALLGASDTFLPLLRDPVFYTRLNHLREEQSATPPKRTVVLLGASRFQCGLRGQLLGPQLTEDLGRPVFVTNWGTGGWGFFRSLLSWERLERHGVRPDVVLIDAVPVLPNARHPHRETTEQVLPSHELDACDAELLLRHDPQRADVHRQRWLARLAPAYGFRTNIRRILAPRLDGKVFGSLAELRGDFLSQFTPDRRPAATAYARQEHYDRLQDFAVGGPSCRALEELLGRVRASGVRAAMVIMPEGPLFRSWYPEHTWEEVRDYFAAQSRRYGIPLVDARLWMDGEEHFTDSHHLTPEGAGLFSRRFGREVLLPMLRRLPEQVEAGPR